MGLKNLLRRASGLITAFALLASMMVVAGRLLMEVKHVASVGTGLTMELITTMEI